MPPPTAIYTLSLHDVFRSLVLFLALDAVRGLPELLDRRLELVLDVFVGRDTRGDSADGAAADRSEEHTSELQSLTNRVCRLLLDKNKAEFRSPHRVQYVDN